MSSNDYGTEYDDAFDDAELLRLRQRHERRFKVMRTGIIIVTVIAVVVICAVAFRNWRGGSSTNQAELYADNVEKVTEARASMSATLNSSQAALDLLHQYTSNSSTVDDFSDVRTQSQRLLDDAPTYYSAQPHTQNQYVDANNQLETYANRLVNLENQVNEAMKAAGSGEVETGVTTAMNTLRTNVDAANQLISTYNSQTASSQATVTEGYIATVNAALSQAQTDLNNYDSSAAPYQLLESRRSFESDSGKLSAATSSMSAAFQNSKDAGGVSGNSLLAVSSKRIPAGLRTTWTVAGDPSTTVTMTATSIDIKENSTASSSSSGSSSGASASASPSASSSPSASASSSPSSRSGGTSSPSSKSATAHAVHADYALAPGQRTDFGGAPIAAWTLTGVGSDAIDDITIVLYQTGDGDDASTFLGLYQNGRSWKLTTDDSAGDMSNKF